MVAAQPPAGTLLVIDDQATIRDLLQEFLREEGYAVLTAGTIAQSCAALGTFQVDLMLSDAFRPSGEGDPWASLTRLHTAAPTTPLLIISAYPASSFAGYAERGFAGVLPKPFNLDVLAAAIRQALT
jgi:DNA-binding response OmpR family regulator